MELFQSITSKPEKKCPECGKNKLQRLIGTGAGVLFKGDGFWQTDYRSDSYKQGAKADKGDSSSGDKKSDSKSDSTKKDSGDSGSTAKGGEAKSTKKTDSPKKDTKPGKGKKSD